MERAGEEPKESFRQLLHKIANIYAAWTKGVVDIGDMMKKEKLITLLPPQVKAWVTTFNPTSASDAADRADDFVQNHPPPPEAPRRGPYATRPDRTWTSGQRLQGKGEIGPIPKTENRSPNFDPVKGPKCFQCQEYGHLAAKCPKKLTMASWADQTNKLYILPGTIEGQRVERVIIDSGSQITHVHPRHLPADYTKGPAVNIIGSNGHCNSYPTTRVHMEIGGVKITAMAVVNPDPGCDAIVGKDIPELSTLLKISGPTKVSRKTQTKRMQKRSKRLRRKCTQNVLYAIPDTDENQDSSTPSPCDSEESSDSHSNPEESDDSKESSSKRKQQRGVGPKGKQSKSDAPRGRKGRRQVNK